jgi:pimeloyl-ACP methyl ester carboxylesterase
MLYMLATDAHQSRIPLGNGTATLYVSHRSSDAEMRSSEWTRKLAESSGDAPFFACDLRGLGDSQPDTCGPGSFDHPYGSDYFYAIHGIMLDRSYPAQRTYDLLCILQLLASRGHDRVHLAASGWGTIPAIFAGVLSPVVTKISLERPPASFSEIAESEDYSWPLSSFVPGILEHLDLPDCLRVLEKKELEITGTFRV